MTVLSAKNLRKEYHGNPVVESVSLQVETGQIVGLLGLTEPARPPPST